MSNRLPPAVASHDEEANVEEIAIVGMAGRFPGARTVAELWRNLRGGVESIRSFSDDELLREHVPPAALTQPGVVKAGAVLDDVDCFDAEFFGIAKREAEILDPQQRFFLECAWEALESAGHIPSRYRGSIGVFAGASANTYLLSNLFGRRELVEQLGGYQILLASEKDYLATRVSYKLNLTGPSVTIQTACSTSLVAAHLACQSLLNGECDLALAGGVAISVPHRAPYVYQEGGILSPDGHCRAFDAEARGTVPGNGVGIVVLKRVSDAVRDRDHIIAVIKGSAINNDGSSKVGFTAPGVRGQTKVLREALAVAGVDPRSVGYIECHGTGTPLGDPTELEALATAYGGPDPARGCAVGSVKTNIGHLDAAAGVTGLMKAALSVAHGLVVPTVHYRTPNPRFDFEGSPFHVSASLAPWPRQTGPRRAAVSSFGIGGTNAHVILEQAPVSRRGDEPRIAQVLPVSARTPEALARSLERVADAIEADASLTLADVAYTLQAGREAFVCRQAVVSTTRDEVIAKLRAAAAAESPGHRASAVAPEVVFMFPGQGSQYLGMGADLYRDVPTFRTHIDECAELLRAPLGGEDIRRLLWPSNQAETDRASQLLDQTRYTQPATFVIEYALARLWMSWGVRPHALIGHSVGEYAAACIAGVFTLSDALALIAMRGRLIQSLPAGAMLAIFMSERDLRAQLPADLTIAAINGQEQCVVAGATEAVAAFERALVAEGVTCAALRTSHAFHSPMMDPILEPFAAELRRVSLRPPSMRCLSNLTGTWLTDRDATDPAYWARHLREAVRGDGLETLRDDVERVLLEVGPGRTLSQLARRAFQGGAAPTVVSSMRGAGDAQSDVTAVTSALGRLWTSGVAIDWDQVHTPYQPHRVALPTYPFERQRYWIEPAGPAKAGFCDSPSDVGAGFSRPSPTNASPSRFANPVEESIATLWRELIGVEEIQPDSNFFELGGDSLLATQLMSHIRARHGTELPLGAIFEAPTVAGLAALVSAHRVAGTSAAHTDIEPALSPAAPGAPGANVDVDGLTDAEVNALLTQLLQEAES